ncbi:MAG: hypothetical protein PHS41_08405 [Victivallaceae bacterium]|nr:hypothetical protein [Victivallaceae bacterium]
MGSISQNQIDTLVHFIKHHPFFATADEIALGPLTKPPAIQAKPVVKEVFCSDSGRERQGKYLLGNDLEVVLSTQNIDAALLLLSHFTLGDNLLDEDKHVQLSFTPLSDASEKTLTFPHAFLLPEFLYSPGDGNAHKIELHYLCRPDSTTGKPFLYV